MTPSLIIAGCLLINNRRPQDPQICDGPGPDSEFVIDIHTTLASTWLLAPGLEILFFSFTAIRR